MSADKGKVITPTNGRIVWFTPGMDFPGRWHDINRPLAAMICHVWGDHMVNLSVTDSDGVQWPVTSVDLLQPGEDKKEFGKLARLCEWMPYQQGQAAKSENENAAIIAGLKALRQEVADKTRQIEVLQTSLITLAEQMPVYATGNAVQERERMERIEQIARHVGEINAVGPYAASIPESAIAQINPDCRQAGTVPPLAAARGDCKGCLTPRPDCTCGRFCTCAGFHPNGDKVIDCICNPNAGSPVFVGNDPNTYYACTCKPPCSDGEARLCTCRGKGSEGQA